MARPARVDMRLRKPWFLARLRTLGWNVLFTSEILLGAGRQGPAWCQTWHRLWCLARGVDPARETSGNARP
jgi:hypothetical protein